MGLRCSVRGHRFEEPGLVHEREPRGDEVITIRRKVMVCTRCGEQRVLAESKEITRQHTDDRDESDDPDDNTSIRDIDDGQNGKPNMDDITPDTDDFTTDTDNTTTDADNNTTDTDDITTDADDRTDTENTRRETDDGVSGGSTQSEKVTVSEVSESKSESESTASAGIDVIYNSDDAIDDTQSTVEPRQDDGVVLTDDEGGRGYGEWPTKSGERGIEIDDQWEPDELRTAFESTADEGNGHTDRSAIVDAETDDGEIIAADDESDSNGDALPEETFYCPSCEFTVSAPDSPFRSGDSCPECRSEYLVDGT